MKIDPSRPAYVIVFGIVFSAAFTALVTALQVAAEGKIRTNERLRDERALVQAFGLDPAPEKLAEADVERLLRRVDSTLAVTDATTGKSFRVYRAYEGEAGKGEVKALAIPVSGTGFWAPVYGLLAMTPDRAKALRVVFTEQKETPGLGGRIQEEAFQKGQFEGLNLSKPPAGRPYVYVATERPKNESDPRYGRTIEAITGATQTSRAVGRFVNADLDAFNRAMDAHGKP